MIEVETIDFSSCLTLCCALPVLGLFEADNDMHLGVKTAQEKAILMLLHCDAIKATLTHEDNRICQISVVFRILTCS